MSLVQIAVFVASLPLKVLSRTCADVVVHVDVDVDVDVHVDNM